MILSGDKFQCIIQNSIKYQITRTRPASASERQAPQESPGENAYVKFDSPLSGLSQDGIEETPVLETSPRPPSAPPSGRPRPKRPASSYGIRSQPLPAWGHYDGAGMFGTGYYCDVSPLYNEEDGFDEYDADTGVLSACAVNKGDRVMIQSKITGELQSDACSILINVSKRPAKCKRKPPL